MNKDYMFNYLHGTDIWLYQRKDMFRVNTDTSLLGKFMKVYPGESVLDIGTNNGALLLYASQYTKGKLIGVDVLEEACVLAKKNLEYNAITNYELHAMAVQQLVMDPVDVIVSNPPYFPVSAHMNQNPNLQIARHEVLLSLDALAQSVARLLKKSGRCYLVHRASREEEILSCFAKYGLYAKCKQKMYDEHKAEAISLLLEFTWVNEEMVCLPDIYIERCL